MNKQYQELQVEQGVFIPEPAINYPEENPFERTLFPTYTKDLVIDENFPYLDDSLSYRLNLLWGYYLVIHGLLRLKLRVQMGLRIRGRERAENALRASSTAQTFRKEKQPSRLKWAASKKRKYSLFLLLFFHSWKVYILL